MTYDHSIEPAGTTGSAGGSAEFTALVGDHIAGLVVQLGREWTLAHTGGISLCNTDDVGNHLRTYTGTDARTCCNGVRRGNIRISTEVDVQQGCLRTLKHNGLSSLVCLIGQYGNVIHILCQALSVFGIFCDHSVQVKCLAAVNCGNDLVFQFAGCPCLFCENLRMNQVVDTQTAALILVHIGRTNTTLGRTDIRVATEILRQTVQCDMPRHNHMSTRVDLQVCGGNPTAFQTIQLRDEVLRIEDNTGTDQTQGLRVQDAGWDQMQLVHLTVVDNGMTGIVAARCTDNHICTGCHNVNDLTLSFVSPL